MLWFASAFDGHFPFLNHFDCMTEDFVNYRMIRIDVE